MPAAARIGDFHECKKSEPGPVPHVGGPILPARKPTVFIGGMPAAVKGDPCFCVGVPDQIDKGSATVEIYGKAAARMNDLTQHKGSIKSGCATVIVGG